MKDNITIGIEGLVGSGKTSLCRALLEMIPNSIILHGGNLYRGIVFALMKSGVDITKMQESLHSGNPIDIKQIMDMLKVELKIENRESVDNNNKYKCISKHIYYPVYKFTNFFPFIFFFY